MKIIDKEVIILQKVMYHLVPVFDQYGKDEVINAVHDYFHNKNKDKKWEVVNEDQ